MLKLSRDGELVSVEVSRNGSLRGAVTVWRRGTEESLAADALNLIAARDRQLLLEQLPEDVREDAAKVLLFLAVELAQRGHEAGQGDGDEPTADDGPFPRVEPWPDPVDGAALLDDVCEFVARYLILPPHAGETIALWILHTYVADVADYTPYLLVTSPVRECGKSTLLELLEQLGHRAMLTGGLTAAALYRRIDRLRPTALLDELDTRLRGDSGEYLRGVLNTGFHRSGKVTICVGEDFEDKDFSTFCPKVLAGIGRVWDTVTSRSIPIRMQRASKEQLAKLEKIRGHTIAAKCEPFKQRLVRWALDAREAIAAADPEVPNALGARQSDIWRPILAVADAAGGKWPEAARAAALALHGVGEEEGDYGLLALGDVREIFDQQDAKALTTETLLRELVKREDRPWPEYGKSQKPLTPRGLASLMGRFGVKPKDVRVGIEVQKGYTRADLTPAWRTYLPTPTPDPDLSATSATRATDNDLGDSVSATRSATVADREVANPLPHTDVADVADKSGSGGQVSLELADDPVDEGLPPGAGEAWEPPTAPPTAGGELEVTDL